MGFNSIRNISGLLNAELKKRAMGVVLLTCVVGLFDALGVAFLGPYFSLVLGIRSSYTFFGQSIDLFQGTLAVSFIIISGTLCRILNIINLNKLIYHTEKYFNNELMRSYLSNDYRFFIANDTRDLGKNIVGEVIEFINKAFIPAVLIISNCILIAFVGATLLFIFPIATGVLLLFLVTIYLLIFFAIRDKLATYGQLRLQANEERFRIVGDVLRNLKTLKINKLDEKYISAFSLITENFRKFQTKAQILSQFPRPLIEGVLVLSVIFYSFYFYGLVEEKNNEDELIKLTAFAFAGYKLIPALQAMYQSWSHLKYSERLIEMMNNQVLTGYQKFIKKPENIPVFDGGEVNAVLKTTGVTFEYREGEPVFPPFSGEFKNGESIAVMGPSGSGKTTFLDMIAGLLNPTEGQIEYNSSSVKISYACQEVHIFDGGLLENIVLSKDGFNKIRLEKVLEIVRLDEVFPNIKSEYKNIPIPENGKNLSGGQRQRIGIARAIYQAYDILILDEPTSALDGSASKKIIEEIIENNQGIIFLVTHDERIASTCQRVITLDMYE